MVVKLNLKEDHAQVETELGTIDIWQIEGGELFTVEIFPPNQSEESFEAGEFTNVWNVLEVATDMDSVYLKHFPKSWTLQQMYDMSSEAVTAIFSLLSTIQNLEDLKDVTIDTMFSGLHTIPTNVYESIRVIRNKYNDNFCAFCGCELNDSNRRQNEYEITVCEDCFIEQQAKKLNVK